MTVAMMVDLKGGHLAAEWVDAMVASTAGKWAAQLVVLWVAQWVDLWAGEKAEKKVGMMVELKDAC